jgi:hypothetical protein
VRVAWLLLPVLPLACGGCRGLELAFMALDVSARVLVSANAAAAQHQGQGDWGGAEPAAPLPQRGGLHQLCRTRPDIPRCDRGLECQGAMCVRAWRPPQQAPAFQVSGGVAGEPTASLP